MALRWFFVLAGVVGLSTGHWALVTAAWDQISDSHVGIEAASLPILLWYDVLLGLIARDVKRVGVPIRVLVVAIVPASLWGLASIWSAMQPPSPLIV